RPAFTDPEILRTNLAAVILQMLHLRLGRIEDFPFIEPPAGRAISDGFNLLPELGAVERDGSITEVGRQLARLPVDPRIGRMLIEAAVLGSLQEVLIIASALAVQDPRERPIERQQAADQAHAQWRDDQSDFAAFVNLWRGFEEQRQDLSQNQLRSWCRRQFLNYLRMREWRETHRQLLLTCRDLGLQSNPEPAGYDPVHKALLAGLLSHLGNKTEEGDYLGARQRRLMLHPSSALAKRRPAWVMVAELSEARPPYGRLGAQLDALRAPGRGRAGGAPVPGGGAGRRRGDARCRGRRGRVGPFLPVPRHRLGLRGGRQLPRRPLGPRGGRGLLLPAGLLLQRGRG